MDFSINLNFTDQSVIAILDKLEKACGWMVVPKGKKVHRNESEDYFKKSILADDNLTDLEKSALISNRRSILKQFENQYDIFSIAMNNLGASVHPDEVENSWLMDFSDKSKNICEEDLQLIWGKILAEEINNPDSIPKRLLHILSIISRKEARAFMKLNNNTIVRKKTGEIIPLLFSEIEDTLKHEEILKLSNLGLLNYDEIHGFYLLSSENEIFECGNTEVELPCENEKKIYLGNTRYTEEGQILAKMLCRESNDGLAEAVVAFREKRKKELLLQLELFGEQNYV